MCHTVIQQNKANKWMNHFVNSIILAFFSSCGGKNCAISVQMLRFAHTIYMHGTLSYLDIFRLG